MAEIAPDWIALDWGTSTCRAWAMAEGAEPLAEARSDRGMGALAPDEFEPALLDLVGDWTLGPGTPVVACGMVGARQGWAEAPCRPVPCPPLAPGAMCAPATDPRLDVRIVPGLSQTRPPDVMRGEETQIAGFLEINPKFDGVICLPGSHTKWVRISAGEVVSFQTAMTGELFGLISTASVLRHSLDEGWDEAAFTEALSDTLSRPETIATRLFALRAGALLDPADGAGSRARLSGYLIGAELAATRAYWLGMETALIGDRMLSDRYAAALAAQGVPVARTRADALTLHGLAAARRALKDTS